MLMSEYDDVYVDAMLMVNMQANTRSVTIEPILSDLNSSCFTSIIPSLMWRALKSQQISCQVTAGASLGRAAWYDSHQVWAATLTVHKHITPSPGHCTELCLTVFPQHAANHLLS